ncbi:MAG: hypothetical protein OXO56_15405 [Gammaproteobacteria bacterium]|nr:hypothetical protein [Gammaproteobacteria bacterium]
MIVVTQQLGDLDTNIPGRLVMGVTESGSGRGIEGTAVSPPREPARMTDRLGWVECRGPTGWVAEVTVNSSGYETHTLPVSLHEGG